MPYAELMIKTYQSNGIAACNSHNERLKEEYDNPDFYPERTPDNYYLVRPEGPYKEACLDMIQKAGCRKRSNSVMMVEIVIDASYGFVTHMPCDQQRIYFERALDFLSERVEKDRFISAVVHMDERKPHMHVTFCPITGDGRLCWSDIRGSGRAALCRWQDEFYAHMHGYYPEIIRGLPARMTKRKNFIPRVYRLTEDIYPRVRKIYERLRQVNIFNKDEICEEVLEDFGKIRNNCFYLAMNAENLAAQNEKLGKAADGMDDEIRSLTLEVEEVRDELDDAEAEVRELKAANEKQQEVIMRFPRDMLEGILAELEAERRRAAERHRAYDMGGR